MKKQKEKQEAVEFVGTLALNGIEYKTVFRSGVLKDNEAYGYTSFVEEEIHIYSELSQRRQFEVLLHEIIEVANYQNQLKLPHHAIMTIGQSLLQAFMDNPLLCNKLWDLKDDEENGNI